MDPMGNKQHFADVAMFLGGGKWMYPTGKFPLVLVGFSPGSARSTLTLGLGHSELAGKQRLQNNKLVDT